MNKMLSIACLVFMLQTAQLATAQDCKDVKYNIVSAGFNFGDYLTMTINGKTVIDTNDQATMGNNDQKRGFIIVQVNENNGEYIEHKIFDTHASSQKSKDMAAYINSIPNGRVVMTGVNDEGANRLESQGIAALKTVGAAADFKLAYRESYALVGVKGEVSKPWDVQQSTTSKVNIETDFVMCEGQAPRPVGSPDPKAVATQEPAGECKDVKYNIVSAGWAFGDFLTMTINGKTVIDTNDQATMGNNDQKRGFIIVQVNENNGEYIEHKIFDTHASSQKSKDMAAYINSIPNGRVVMTGVNDEGAGQLESQGIAALKTVGAAADFKLAYRESYALVGVKGDVSKPWNNQQSTTSKVSIETDFTMCPGQKPVPKGEGSHNKPDEVLDVSGSACPIIYSECNFQGRSMAICGEEPDIGEWTVKSVSVPKGYKVTLYLDTVYEGEWVEYREDQKCIDAHVFNDPKFLLQNKMKVSTKIDNLNSAYSSFKVQKLAKKTNKHQLKKNLRTSRKL